MNSIKNNTGAPAFSDATGYETLANISSADKFNRWMYQTIAPFCNGHILEIGGGIGNISQCVLADNKTLTVTELQEEYCEIIRKQIGHLPKLQQVICLDIVDPEFDTKYQHLFERFDSVFALNVIEHIDDDRLAIENCKKLLKPNGLLIILVPAFMSLFNSFDSALGHFRRYKKKSLSSLMGQSQLQIVHLRYFNFIGMLGWWFSGNVLRKKIVPEGQMKLYNFFVPIFRIIDYFTKPFAGLSVIAAGRKTETDHEKI